MNPYLLKGLLSGPVAMERLLGVIPVSAYDEALNPERFTIREVVAHLADWEPIFLARMRLVNENPGTSIQVYDEGERAMAQNYGQSDIAERLAEFQAQRQRTVAFLSGLSPEDFDKPYEHPENGTMRLADQANMLLGHDLYHIEQIAAYLSPILE